MKKARMRRRGLSLGAMVLGVSMMMTAASSTAFAADGESLVIGAKDFTGAALLSQLYGQALQAKGFDVEFKDVGPTEVTYPALENGDIDGYGEFQGTLLENEVLGGTATGDTKETYAALQDALDGSGIVASKPAPAVDANGFYVSKATAKKYKLKTVTDLVDVADQLVFGGPPECLERDFCLGAKSKDLYGLEFSEVKKLDVGGPITAQALEDGDIDVAILFTGSSVIPKGAVLLTDDQQLQPADNPVFLVSEAKASKKLLKVVNAVSAKLTTAAYNKMSFSINEDKEDPADVATAFLKKNKLD
jgi:osmoprotectant transport system substrate-binding protein